MISTLAMHRVRTVATGALVAERLRLAHTHWTRLRGLLGTAALEPGEGLWIQPCRQVHMFGMRYAIDVVFLDAAARIVGVVGDLAPWRMSPKFADATSVVELPAGTAARLGLQVGAALAIEAPDAATRSASGVRWRNVGALATNLLLATLWLFFASAHWATARATGQWTTTMPIVVQELLLVVLFLTRRRSHATSERPLDWVVGIAGTFLPMGLRPGPATEGTIIGPTIQLAGLLLAIVAVASLGRSIGVVAANRGIKMEGAYRVVRHPMYAAHLTSYLGYVLSHHTARNLLIVAGTLVALVLRARAEERLLAGDTAYARYLRRVRWRFVPYVY